MFADAYAIARHFTSPTVLSTVHRNGDCHAAIGTFVVINSDGYALTASHILDLAKSNAAQVETQSKRKAIEADTNLDWKANNVH